MPIQNRIGVFRGTGLREWAAAVKKGHRIDTSLASRFGVALLPSALTTNALQSGMRLSHCGALTLGELPVA